MMTQPVMPQIGNGSTNGWGGYGFSGWGGDKRLDANNGFTNNMFGILQQFMQNGAFSPGGNSFLMQAADRHARQQADALNSQNALAASLYGMDPSQQAAMRLQSMMGNDRNVSDLLGNANLGQLLNQQQFGEGLLNSMNNYNNQWQLNGDRFTQDMILGKMGAGQRQPTDWGGIAGGIGGLLAGLGGLGI